VVEQFAFHLLDVAQQRPCVLQQCCRRDGQFQPLVATHEQRRLEDVFELRHALAERRSRDVLEFRSPRDAAVFADGDEKLQRLEVEAQVNLRGRDRSRRDVFMTRE